MSRQYIKFADLPLKAQFAYNGNKCVKQSTRTAELIGYARRFYFAQRTLVTVGLYCVIEPSIG